MGDRNIPEAAVKFVRRCFPFSSALICPTFVLNLLRRQVGGVHPPLLDFRGHADTSALSMLIFLD